LAKASDLLLAQQVQNTCDSVQARNPGLWLSDRDGPSIMYTLMGAFAPAKGGRLALANML